MWVVEVRDVGGGGPRCGWWRYVMWVVEVRDVGGGGK